MQVPLSVSSQTSSRVIFTSSPPPHIKTLGISIETSPSPLPPLLITIPHQSTLQLPQKSHRLKVYSEHDSWNYGQSNFGYTTALPYENHIQQQQQQQGLVAPSTPNVILLKPKDSRDSSPNAGIFASASTYHYGSDIKSPQGLPSSRFGLIATTTIASAAAGVSHQRLLSASQIIRSQPLQIQLQQSQRTYSLDPKPRLEEHTNHLIYSSKQAASSRMDTAITPLSIGQNIQEISNTLLGLSEAEGKRKIEELEKKICHTTFTRNNSEQPSKFSHDKEEVSRLYALCQEKDEIIDHLMEEVTCKPSKEMTAAEKTVLLGQVSSFKSKIIELENKVLFLTTENDRLTRKLQDQEYDFQRNTSESAYRQDKLNLEIEEIIQTYEEKLNTNEQLVAMNEGFRVKLVAIQENSDRQAIEETERSRVQWQEYYAREAQQQLVQAELERRGWESQIKQARKVQSETEERLQLCLNELQTLSTAILEKDILLREFHVQLTGFDRLRKQFNEATQTNDDLIHRNKQSEEQVQALAQENEKLCDMINSLRVDSSENRSRLAEAEERLVRQKDEASKGLAEQKIVFQKTERASYELLAAAQNEEKMSLMIRIVLVQAENEMSHLQIISLNRRINDLQFETKQYEQQLELQQIDQSLIIERNEDLQRKIEQLILNVDELNQGLQLRLEEVEVWREKYQFYSHETEERVSEMRSYHAEALQIVQTQANSEVEELTKKLQLNASLETSEKLQRITELQHIISEKQSSLTILEAAFLAMSEDSTGLQKRLSTEVAASSEKTEQLAFYERIHADLKQQHSEQIEELKRRLALREIEVSVAAAEKTAKAGEVENMMKKVTALESEVEKKLAILSEMSVKLAVTIELNEKLLMRVSEVESGRKEEIERIRIKHVAEQETQRRDLREIFENEKFSIEGAWKSQWEALVREHSSLVANMKFTYELSVKSLTDNLEQVKSHLSQTERENTQLVEALTKVKREKEVEKNQQDSMKEQQNQLEQDFEHQTNKLLLIINENEREFQRQRMLIEELQRDFANERALTSRYELDLERTCLDIEIWRGKAGQIDPNHPYLIEMQSQLDTKRRDNLELQSRLHESERRRNDLERTFNRTKTSRLSYDGQAATTATTTATAMSHNQSLIKSLDIPLERSTLTVLDENQKVSRLLSNSKVKENLIVRF